MAGSWRGQHMAGVCNAVDFRLEVVRTPVSDVDRAKDFYQGLSRWWAVPSGLLGSAVILTAVRNVRDHGVR